MSRGSQRRWCWSVHMHVFEHGTREKRKIPAAPGGSRRRWRLSVIYLDMPYDLYVHISYLSSYILCRLPMFISPIYLPLSFIYVHISYLSSCLPYMFISPIYLHVCHISSYLLSIFMSAIYVHISYLSSCLPYMFISPIYLHVCLSIFMSAIL